MGIIEKGVFVENIYKDMFLNLLILFFGGFFYYNNNYNNL